MAATFDGDELVITLEAPTDGVLQQTSEQIYDDAKQWFLGGENSRFPFPFATSGGDELTPGITAGAYYQLQNDLGWRIRPDESDHTVYVTGSLTPKDATLPIMIPTVGGFTVLVDGLQPITQNVSALLTLQEKSQYDGHVSIDTIDGVSGTTGVIGTPGTPVDNFADALLIRTARVLPNSFKLEGSLTLTTEDITNYIFEGSAASHDTLDLGTATTMNTVLKSLKLQSAVNGTVHCTDCILDNVTEFEGFLIGGAIGGTVTLAGEAHIVNVHAAATGANFITIDLQGNSLPLFLPGWEGAMHIINHSNAGALTAIDMTSGEITLESSCTAGMIVVRGTGTLIDNSAGATVITEGLVDSSDVELARKGQTNRQYTNPASGKIEQYDDADTAIEFEADIYSDNGVTPYDGTTGIERRDKFVAP